VPQDSAEAARWYRKAADQGEAVGQFNLGGMYAEGQGVPQEYVTAHMWLNLAAAKDGEDDAAKARDTIAKEMTREQLAEAQRLAREWKPKPEGKTKPW
jgi:TPR repeat protein